MTRNLRPARRGLLTFLCLALAGPLALAPAAAAKQLAPAPAPAATAAKNHTGAKAKPKRKARAKVSLLFALHAQSGSLTPQGDGRYELRLDAADQQVTIFSDRPYRFATAAPTAALVADWPTLFGDDPPNAALDLAQPDGAGNDLVVLTLDRPRLDGGTLIFSARLVKPSGKQRDQAERVVEHVPATFGSAAVFIDDFSAFVNSLVTTTAQVAKTVAPIVASLL